MVKIKPKCLSLPEKTKLIEDYENGVSVTALSRKYGVAKSTVCSIKNKKKKIIEAVAHISTRNKKRTLKKAEFPKMERALYRWFIKQREKNLTISAEILRQKALFFHKKCNQGVGNFNASYGWLQRFKKRFDIRFLKITGEKLSSAPELVNPFKKLLKLKIEELNLNRHQIYNADETGLFWKLLPEKTYVSLNEKTAPGLKMAKQRITFLGCTNAAGSHKLKSLIIGKSNQPRCFKNFNNPAIYRGNKSVWMTLAIFKEWFFKHFVTEVRVFLKNKNLPQHAILLLDNAPSHPSAEELKTPDGKIFVMFMPPNVTPLIQRMDQNVLRLTKLYYRNSLLKSIILKKKSNIAEALKSLTLKDTVLTILAAWNKLEQSIITKTWNNLLSNNTEFDDEDDLPLSVLQRQWNEEAATITESIALLDNLQNESSTTTEFSKIDVEERNKDTLTQEDKTEEVEDDDDEDLLDDQAVQMNERVSHSDAIKALDLSLKWTENNGLSTEDILM